MKGKLIKTTSELGYALVIQPCSVSNKLKELPTLSLKNCQVIENGYDLDELTHEAYTEKDWGNGEGLIKRRIAFKLGFQKALELLNDKKFNEELLLKFAKYLSEEECRGFDDYVIPFIQSLQQTEWDVEIEMETYPGLTLDAARPNLDTNGCLILKRI